MQHEQITTPSALLEYCDHLASVSLIAFDTEFVSEDTYRPELCLVQVAAGGRLAMIDPFACGDMTPFWNVLVSGQHQTVVHAGREEFRFCLDSQGQRPADWFDVQIAAGMAGYEYPASYGSLLSKLVKKTLAKGETRTDWRRRPLSARQIEYALQDVIYLEAMRDALVGKLKKLKRIEWLADELQRWQDQLEAFESSEQWRRVSGVASLKPRSLAIVRELWRWRNQQAQKRNSPPKRVLRDDLVVEIARRQTDDVKRIRALRGMERRNLQSNLSNIANCVERALAEPEDALPRPLKRTDRSELNVIGQFLATALGGICREAKVAPGLVGSVQDVRDLISYKLGLDKRAEPPSLATGWRAQVVGNTLDDILQGKTMVRVVDPRAEQPLGFVRPS